MLSALAAYQRGFAGRKVKICYALKANSSLAILQTFLRAGCGFDIVSAGELERVLAAGARAYLLKSATDEDLIPAVRAVASGKPFFSPAVAAVLVEDYVRTLQQRGLTDSYHLLTDREKEIFQLLAEGKSNKDVAALLNLSPYTVETHRTNIMQKLDLHSSVDLVLYAVRKKVITF